MTPFFTPKISGLTVKRLTPFFITFFTTSGKTFKWFNGGIYTPIIKPLPLFASEVV